MRVLFLCITAFIISSGFAFAGNPYFLNKKGIESYDNKDFSTALKYFSNAYKEDEKSEFLFNKGVSLYKLKKYDNASSLFYNVLNSAHDNDLKEKSLYNLGVISFQKKKPKEALSFFKKALQINPDDQEARINYEIILKQLKNKTRNNKKKSNNSNDKKKKNQNKDNKNNKKQKNNNKRNEKRRKNAEKKNRSPSENNKKKMKKIDGKILNLYSDDKKLLKESIKKRFGSKIPKPEKDW